jgi:hypothetical protein
MVNGLNPALIPAILDWTARTVNTPTPIWGVNAAVWALAPFVVSDILWWLYTKVDGIAATLLNGLRNVTLAAWALIVAAVCLALPQPQAALQLKDYLGYAVGLVATVLVWQLHTTVHLGLVQMWRYTKGAETEHKVAGKSRSQPSNDPAAGKKGKSKSATA